MLSSANLRRFCDGGWKTRKSRLRWQRPAFSTQRISFLLSQFFCRKFSIRNSLLCFRGTEQLCLGHHIFVENFLSNFELCISIIIIFTYGYTPSNTLPLFSENSSTKNIMMSESMRGTAPSHRPSERSFTKGAWDILGSALL